MRKTTTEITIVMILWVSIIISIIRNPSFGPQFIFGIISVVTVSTALLLRKKDLSLGILTFALILSTFNAVKFSEAFSLSMGFVQLIPFILLLFVVFSRFVELMNLKEKWFGDDPTEIEKAQENKIAFFKREFQNLPSEELIRRGNNDKLVEEARMAIDKLLNEREITTNI
ncbi:MAG TPA: hypothetical protein VFS71_07945 [Flavobacterium sp.]|uniref:hypothetical protein n=1 Tax=Flavobacterium sp. TaxID=239 RepID=UPI002DBFA8EA|nr:hypothetical protein [Flavobacterium sp.]HEU4789598.1 hypothetical protein [Flavobacterium sp.]